MSRISIIVSFLLFFGVTAKPWTKPKDEAFRKTVLSINEIGKLSWMPEVEPPEDMDGTHYEILSTEDRRKGEGDTEDVDHSVYLEVPADEPVKLWDEHQAREKLAGFLAPLVAGRGADVQDEERAPHVQTPGRKYLQPEEDMDDLYHKRLLIPDPPLDEVPPAAGLPPQRRYSKPEEDLDGVYHK